MKKYKVFVINPGSTSTKIALFEGRDKVFSANVSHDAEHLKQFQVITDQLPYREKTINELLEKNKIDLRDVDAYVGRGGGLLPLEGGTYIIDDLLLDHAYHGADGISHPAQLGSTLAYDLAKKYGKNAYIVNSPDTDELQDVARVTGLKGVYRHVHMHALNLKETAIHHSELKGIAYEDANYIVCHIGGGVSISAHQKGQMIDGTDNVDGEGPMAPTRCGAIPVLSVIDYVENSHEDLNTIRNYAMKTGGFVSHLNTSDAQEVCRMIEDGNKYAKLIWDSFIYQIEKYIGAMSMVLKGRVDGILLGGGIVHNEELVERISEDCSWIAPVYAYPGEFEMEAMAFGAIRVLEGKEEVKHYSGKPRWNGFDYL